MYQVMLSVEYSNFRLTEEVPETEALYHTGVLLAIRKIELTVLETIVDPIPEVVDLKILNAMLDGLALEALNK